MVCLGVRVVGMVGSWVVVGGCGCGRGVMVSIHGGMELDWLVFCSVSAFCIIVDAFEGFLAARAGLGVQIL